MTLHDELNDLMRRRDKAESRWISLSWERSFDVKREWERLRLAELDEAIQLVEHMVLFEKRKAQEAEYGKE